MNKQADYIFIDNNLGTLLSQKGALKATRIRDDFQKYLDAFNQAYATK